MGTRHLIEVRCDGQTRIAQYGQWDGYWDYTGENLLKVLVEADLGELRKAATATRFLTDDEVKERWEFAISRKMDDTGMVTWDEGAKFTGMFPALSRDTGWRVLLLLLAGTREFYDSSDFADDKVFCEWHYVIDLDEGTLVAYCGDTMHCVEDFAQSNMTS